MKRSVLGVLAVGAIGLLDLTTLDFASATVYRCIGPSGKSIYTDSPAQLNQCTPVHTGSASESVSTPSSSQISPNIPNTMPGSPSQPAPPPDAMVNLPTEASVLAPATAGGDRANERCLPGLNPLNPFTVTCQPPDAAPPPSPPMPPMPPMPPPQISP